MIEALCLQITLVKMDEIHKTEDNLSVRTIYIPDVIIHVSTMVFSYWNAEIPKEDSMLLKNNCFHGDFRTIQFNQMRCDYCVDNYAHFM